MPLTPDTFEKYLVAPRRAEGEELPAKYASLDAYATQISKPENLGHRPEFVVVDASGKLERVGSRSDIEGYFNDPARAKWRRQVDSFDSDEAKSFGALDDEEAYPSDVPLRGGQGFAAAAGAAASDTRQIELVPFGLDQIPGVRTVVEKTSPMQRLFGAESVTVRRTAADLAETSLLTKENLEGKVTTAGPALDREARLHINQGQVAVGDELSRLFSEYRFGEQKTAPRVRAAFDDMRG